MSDTRYEPRNAPQSGATYSNQHDATNSLSDIGMSSQAQPGTLENIQSYWPLRLLHAGKMESIPRSVDDDHVNYGGTLEPSYNIISYTWGRYQDDQTGEAVAIMGPGGRKLDWNIPKVDKTKAFGAERFSSVLKSVAGHEGFVWVDVACINQSRGAPEYAAEIGNQAAIFNRAKHSYVWLHQTCEEDLRKALEIMTAIVAEARITQVGVNSHEEYKGNHNIPKRKEHQGVIAKLLKDPWFSSLWTLQEAYIQKDAIILSKEGQTLQLETDSTPQLLTVRSLSTICTELREWVWQDIKTLIEEAGLHQLQSRNPLSLLSTSARRVTKRQPDRVYGIMQIFGLRLGKAADGVDPSQEFSLGELEKQLSLEVIRSTPSLSQLFLHRDTTSPGRAWRHEVGIVGADKHFACGAIVPGRNMTLYVPSEFHNAVEISRSCEISLSDGRPRFEGYKWPLAALRERWIDEEGQPSQEGSVSHTADQKTPDMNKFGRSLFLDHFSGIEATGVMPAEFASWGKPVTIADSVESRYPRQLSILVLGRIRDGKTGEEAWAGMLARTNGRQCSRVGFCTWQGEAVETVVVDCELK